MWLRFRHLLVLYLANLSGRNVYLYTAFLLISYKQGAFQSISQSSSLVQAYFWYLNNRVSWCVWGMVQYGMKTVGTWLKKPLKLWFGLQAWWRNHAVCTTCKKHMENIARNSVIFDATYERYSRDYCSSDYIGCHPNGQSLEYIKRIDGNVLVAVRLCDKLNCMCLWLKT